MDLALRQFPMDAQEVADRLKAATTDIKEGRRSTDLGRAVQDALVVVSWANATHMVRQLEAVSRQLEVTSDGQHILVLNVPDGTAPGVIHADRAEPGLSDEFVQGSD